MNNKPAPPKLGLLDTSFLGAYSVDSCRTIRYWNRSAERIMGQIAENAVGRPCCQIAWNPSADREEQVRRRTAAPASTPGRPNAPSIRVIMPCASDERMTAAITMMETLISETVLMHLFHESGDNSGAEQETRYVD